MPNTNKTLSPDALRLTLNTWPFAVGRHDVLLPLFFRQIPFHINPFACCRINARPVQQCRPGGGQGREDLHLLGCCMQIARGEGLKSAHIFFGASRMSGDKIIGQKLLKSGFCIHLFKKILKFRKRLRLWLAHQRQHGGCSMLRCDLQLAGNMMFD